MNFITVFAHEAKRLFSDAAIVLTIIGGVVLYSFLYPQPYARQSVSGLSVSVVDYDKSDVSRSVIFKLNATPQIVVTRNDMSELDAKEALIRGDVRAIIIIPHNFKRDLTLNESPTIAVGADSGYFLIYGSILEGAMKSILTQSATIKVVNLLKKQVPLSEAEVSYAPFSMKVINLFNRDNSYTQYVVPAVFVLILQQTLLIGLGIFGGGINEEMRRQSEGYFKKADIWKMYLSRYLLFGGIFLVHMLFYFGFSFELFDVTRLGRIPDLLNFGAAFLTASIALGLFLGSLFSSREAATPIVLFSSMPLVFSVGFVWPVEAIPSVIHYLSLLVPSTPGINGFLALNQMGANFESVKGNYLLLWIQAFIYMTLAFLVFRKRRRAAYRMVTTDP